jgi:hypothetical protein
MALMNDANPCYKDQFTNLHVSNMTEYYRLVFFDADTLPIKPIYTIFDTPTQWKGNEEWLFAAVYDSGNSRADNERNPPGLEDKGRPEDKDLNGSHLYNTQWCRREDLDTAWEAYGEMIGWASSRYGEGVQQWEKEEGKIVCDYAGALIANN